MEEGEESPSVAPAGCDAWLTQKGLSHVARGLDSEELHFWWSLRSFLREQLELTVGGRPRSLASAVDAPSLQDSSSSRPASSLARAEKRRRFTCRGENPTSRDAKKVKFGAAAAEEAADSASDAAAGSSVAEASLSPLVSTPLRAASACRCREDSGAREGGEKNPGAEGREPPPGREGHGEGRGGDNSAAKSSASGAYLVEGADLSGERRVSCLTTNDASALQLSFSLACSPAAPPLYGHPAASVFLLLREALRTRVSSDFSLSVGRRRARRQEGGGGAAAGDPPASAGRASEAQRARKTMKTLFNPVAHEGAERKGSSAGAHAKEGDDEAGESLSLSMLILAHHVRALSPQWIADWIVAFWLSLFQAVFAFLAARQVSVHQAAARAIADPLREFFSMDLTSALSSSPPLKGDADAAQTKKEASEKKSEDGGKAQAEELGESTALAADSEKA
ncbi:hypothetical protein BESB_013440 [Besnoitia besnoiti]|uniref:Transmembrane protein n=1 Tax=Besnoitia besnoiti TaxID=94643 RepID=A0A2A9MBG8_BESBE|nr:hypothetical protein BESB_013440 [Besnoitia besnoiti]PFH32732.1 hypothetical protein BESB_013440 [Besnoitia besnoiti]